MDVGLGSVGPREHGDGEGADVSRGLFRVLRDAAENRRPDAPVCAHLDIDQIAFVLRGRL